MGGAGSHAVGSGEAHGGEFGRGGGDSGSGDLFPAESTAADVPGVDWDWVVHKHFEEIDSTQSFAERESEAFDRGKLTAVSADFQTAGRGTRERTWRASRGQSVLVSFFFRFPEECPTPFVNENVPNVTKVLALAAVDALRWAVAADPEGRRLEFGIKWPNDIVVSGRKLGGIIARAVPSRGCRLDGVIVGIGINVNTPPEDLDQIDRPVWPATSLFVTTGGARAYDVAAIRRRLIGAFAAELPQFFAEGFVAFRDRVNSLEVLMGTEVRFRVHETEEVDGTFDGVDDNGLIVLRLANGKSKSYPSGEIIPRLEE